MASHSNGVARIFFGGGPPGTFSSPFREPTAFSGGGGGVVAEIFRDLNYQIAFSEGGGGSSRNFSRYTIFGPPADHPPFMDTRGNSGTLPMSAYTFKPCNNINSFRKKHFTKSLGGPWPPWPPPWLRHCPIALANATSNVSKHAELPSL